MNAAEEERKLYWASRRGMLELDLLLIPFTRERLPGLSPARRADYTRLLEADDPQLYDWLLGAEVPEDPELRWVVAEIRAFGLAGETDAGTS